MALSVERPPYFFRRKGRIDGRRAGPREAWLLTVEARDAFDRRLPDEILRVDLESGDVLGRWRTPEGIGVTEIDWIGDAP